MTTCHLAAAAHSPKGPADVITASRAFPEHTTRVRGFVASLLVTTVLAACGAGGDEASGDESVSSAAANDAAADTTVVGSDAMAAIDATVLAAEAVVATQVGAVSAASVSASAAPKATAAATASVPVSCPGGGSAVLSISGGSASSVLNGQFDAGETYAVTFSACQFQTGGAAVTGAADLTVESLSGTQARLALDMDTVTVQLVRGSVALDGGLVWQGSQVTEGSTMTVATDLSIGQLGLTSTFGARTGSFTLSSVDVSRQGVWVDGVLTSSAMSGTYTITRSRPNNAFEATVTTSGQTQFGADGAPTTGVWNVAFTTWAMQMSATAQTVTLSIDQGKDGSIERTYTTTRSDLLADAG